MQIFCNKIESSDNWWSGHPLCLVSSSDLIIYQIYTYYYTKSSSDLIIYTIHIIILRAHQTWQYNIKLSYYYIKSYIITLRAHQTWQTSSRSVASCTHKASPRCGFVCDSGIALRIYNMFFFKFGNSPMGANCRIHNLISRPFIFWAQRIWN